MRGYRIKLLLLISRLSGFSFRMWHTRRNGARLPLALVPILAGLASTAWPQAVLDQAQVGPRLQAVHETLERGTIKSNVDLVLVNVTVLDRADKVVMDLQPGNFSILEDKRPQRIKYVFSQDAPISLMLVLDTSGSMENKIEEARQAALLLFKTSNPLDEFSIATFGEEPRLIADAGNLKDVETAIALTKPIGKTSLWDAMYLGVQRLKRGSLERKAIIVISDGGDNHSRYTEEEVKSALKETNIQVYAIGIFDPVARTPDGRMPVSRPYEEKMGPVWLDEITAANGGRVIAAHGPTELARAADQIGTELRSEYVIGYYPTNRDHDGKWRKVKVQLDPSPAQGKLRVFAKNGYYGPEE